MQETLTLKVLTSACYYMIKQGAVILRSYGISVFVTVVGTAAVFNIGHFNMEELGMRYAQDWIGDLVDHKVPVHYLPTKDIYRYIERKHL